MDEAVYDVIYRINRVIINPLIIFLFALALLYFVYGVFTFIRSADDPTARQTGARHMFWGIVGMAIMVGVFSILYFITNTLQVPLPDTIP